MTPELQDELSDTRLRDEAFSELELCRDVDGQGRAGRRSALVGTLYCYGSPIELLRALRSSKERWRSDSVTTCHRYSW
jgi:hypothetical protein